MLSVSYDKICSQGVTEQQFFCQVWTDTFQEYGGQASETDFIFDILKEPTPDQPGRPIRTVNLTGNYDLSFEMPRASYMEIKQFHASLNDLLSPLFDEQFDNESASEDEEKEDPVELAQPEIVKKMKIFSPNDLDVNQLKKIEEEFGNKIQT